MKTLFTIIIILLSFSALAVERKELEQLLLERGTSIAAFEARGLRLVMGERTGGGRVLQFASVEVLFTKDEAILKKEIQNVKLQNGSKVINLESLQANGRHIDGDELVGFIAK